MSDKAEAAWAIEQARAVGILLFYVDDEALFAWAPNYVSKRIRRRHTRNLVERW